MEFPELIRTSRRLARLSQRALAELAGTSAAAVCMYESGERTPRVDTLARILRAADQELVLGARAMARINCERNGRDLWDVLALSDRLPQRHGDRLEAPQFAALTADADR